MPLFLAAGNDASRTVEVLLNREPMFTPKTTNGTMPLHAAAFKNASVTTEVLLKGGADPNAKDKSQYSLTPLHYAAIADAYRTAEVLLKGGADVHAKNKDGANAAARWPRLGMMLLQRLKCCSGRGLKSMPKTTMASTPLHYAARNDASATVEVLLKGGANVQRQRQIPI